ncbi:M16 family metallopeptidase [Leptospirillum ferrooxidans]|uniref:Putative peptidase M16 n=1 Tax=Leptospirillum ferrooxidans (strain C2-3) TaxID=1162668 RepID=I0IQK4_LEPFC|nr:pitrilysin family protein [Leptospirillum ferrooxidans]BAM07553.1 putative peptidase M16 [Leptospirillum ferrooxidans C2-3]
MTKTALSRILIFTTTISLAACAHTSTGAVSRTTQADVSQTRNVDILHTSVTRTVLPNGITVLVIPRPVVPVVSFRIGIRAGSSQDPEGQYGLSDLTASLLDRGTQKHDALSIFRAIDSSGGGLDAQSGRDLTTVSGKVLTEDLEPLFSLAAEMVQTPTFPEEDFQKNQQMALAELTDEKDHPGPVARTLLYKKMMGKGPYGHPESGTIRTVSKLKRSDILSFYRKWYTPDRTIITFSGDISNEKALALVKREFGSWKNREGSNQTRSMNKTHWGNGGKTYLIDREDLAQTTVLMGLPGISRKDPLFYNALVMNQLVGGTTTSRLNHVIRQKMGLVYYIYSGLDAERHRGPFFVSFQTHAENTAKVIKETRIQLQKSARSTPDSKEVTAVKKNLLGSFPFRMDSDDRIASLLLFIENYSLGIDYFTDYPQKISEVTPDSVKSAAQTLIHTSSLTTVIAGPLSKMSGVTGQEIKP